MTRGLPLSFPRFERKVLHNGSTDEVGLWIHMGFPDPDFRAMTWTLEPYSSNHRAACVTIFDSNLPEFVTASERKPFEAFLDAGACPYFVVKSPGDTGSPGGDVVIACGGYHVGSSGARLCWGLVDRHLHRRGIGRFLLQSRLIRIYNEFADTVVTMDTSQLTSAFFESFGFRVVDRIDHGYRLGLHKLEMELKLSEEFLVKSE